MSLNTLSGTIPVSFSILTNLQGLYLYICGLSGTIPGFLGSLAALTDLDLSENALTGIASGSVSVPVCFPTQIPSLRNIFSGYGPGPLGCCAKRCQTSP
jgi:hypothetical protein